MNKPLLSIQNLEISLKEGVYTAVIKNISYDLQQNEILIVGGIRFWESVSSLAIMGLLPATISRISAGEILLIVKCWASEKNWQQRQ
jgi:peptide/nickel transport system ATP-binding protein